MATKSVNKVTLLGTLGRDPEVKYTPSGTAVAKFSMATNDRYKDKDGNWQDRTEWHNIVAWQRTAEIIGEYVKKGDRLYLEGKLQTSSWEDKQSGEKKYRTEIVVNDIVLIGGKRDGGSAGGDESGFTRQKPAARGDNFDQRGPDDSAVASTQITDDDIPF
jgi:single-strand DNA-binding protein